ncbi:hypothetical protein HOLleu_34444 [Holothuria leucospilota]|uniref:Uncharacterized protein n=1 Tax=Holothuria leucospilota TaxID=206669 RepID=A0A9Q1BFC3_HOLLE|nr:hypothetical protein HOLleu_34444 [Holothuria leucospilota]
MVKAQNKFDLTTNLRNADKSLVGTVITAIIHLSTAVGLSQRFATNREIERQLLGTSKSDLDSTVWIPDWLEEASIFRIYLR